MSALEENDVGARPPLLATLPDPFQKEQTVLILVGLIGSGKSTFAQALESYFPRFRRCNQDDLGNRQQVEELAYHTLREGRSPCIDRTNVNATQRSYWSAIARAFPGTSISIIVFDTPYDVCASRLQRRISHPTIKSAQHGMAVLNKFASDFQLPSPDEEYDHIIYLRPADYPRPEYTRDDILSILGRLNASTRVAGTVVTQRNMQSYFGRAGSFSRTNRARGQRGAGGGGGGRQGFSRPRGTLHGSSRFMGRVGGSNSSNWRRPSTGTVSNWEESDHQRSAATASVPPMEGSKGKGSAEERHNST
ncbi:hypothetical protein L210DRAFT_3389039 [Boletus edulis BED1]|uniref:P-loop containing nucleoside triphosphate hydrolase protein n=1 Tax=Boletus edulis BED1 TaxID=1328754 RepID=A0AAD4GKB6_BOLED|nr:hypothetical protein L210DRAFT_3389039 [Boletus edulis BED1]